MIKAKKGNRIILGLSDENLRRLKGAEPILFNLSELGLPSMEVLIFHGADEQAMYESMKSEIHPHKTVITNSRAKENQSGRYRRTERRNRC